jgi:hypothetical protein
MLLAFENGDTADALLRHVTWETAHSRLARASRALLAAVRRAERTRQAFKPEDFDLQQALRRVRERYAHVKAGRALPCVELFTRLLFSLQRERTVRFYVPLPMTMALCAGVGKCIWGFNSLIVDDGARFRARCLLLATLHPAFKHAGGRYYKPRNRTWAVYRIMRENGCRPMHRQPGAGAPHQEMLHYREWQYVDDRGHRAVLQDLAGEQNLAQSSCSERAHGRKRTRG